MFLRKRNNNVFPVLLGNAEYLFLRFLKKLIDPTHDSARPLLDIYSKVPSHHVAETLAHQFYTALFSELSNETNIGRDQEKKMWLVYTLD